MTTAATGCTPRPMSTTSRSASRVSAWRGWPGRRSEPTRPSASTSLSSAGVPSGARLVDSLTGQPVPGVRLWHWQHPGVEGTSGQDGVA